MFITVFIPAYRKHYTIDLCFILKCKLNVFIKYGVCFGMDDMYQDHSYMCVYSKGACNVTKKYVAISNKCLCFYSVNHAEKQILSSTIVFNILYL